jgi:hypothetical protein
MKVHVHYVGFNREFTPDKMQCSEQPVLHVIGDGASSENDLIIVWTGKGDGHHQIQTIFGINLALAFQGGH